MRNYKNLKLSKIAILASLAALMAGCGASTPIVPGPGVAPAAVVAPGAVPPPGQVACAAGQARIGDGPCMTGTFQNVCHYSYGTIITLEGRELCKVTGTHYPSFIGSGTSFPQITPSRPAGAFISTSNVNVRVNDTIAIDQVSGGWGGATTRTSDFLGFIPIDITSTDCGAVSVTGVKDGVVVTSEGQPAGLFGSDGTASFFVGSGLTNQRIAAHGTLRFGFNAPDPFNSCTEMVRLRVKVTHCEDASGLSYLCQ